MLLARSRQDTKNMKVNPLEVGRFIKEREPYKAHGSDGISPFALRELTEILDKPLVMFKSSLYEGNAPRKWKRATVVPVYKKKS